MWNLLLHLIGVEPRTPSTAYNFWSGFGSDVGEFGIVLGLGHAARARNCHVKGCWRIGHHSHGPYKLCSRHHPDVPDQVTEADLGRPR